MHEDPSYHPSCQASSDSQDDIIIYSGIREQDQQPQSLLETWDCIWIRFAGRPFVSGFGCWMQVCVGRNFPLLRPFFEVETYGKKSRFGI